MLNWKIRSSHSPTSTPSDEAIKAYQKTLSSEDIGFFRLPQNKELLEATRKVFEQFKHKKYFIQIGIGGSALGPEMLLSALGDPSGVEFVFLNNIDPDDMCRKLDKVNIKDSLIYVVSKSGTTPETVAAMAIVLNFLKEAGVNEDKYKDYFVFCTDPVKGELRKLSHEWGVHTLEIPSNVGGRFSVLTPVGFLPALFAGINVAAILEGAEDIQKHLSDPKVGKDFFDLAFFLRDLHDKGIHQTVMMPYSSLLKDYSAWFVQLWAESLGKNGKGLTPIPAYGATDQHSQMQLFMEGPVDKVLMLIEVQKFQVDFPLKNSLTGESFKNLAPFHLSDLMKAEFEGTLTALQENGRHVVHLSIPSLQEEFLGQLILFAECLTVMVGELLKVDPFNQPGVEAGKKYAKEWLKNHQ
ncbi:MAG: glucose-6-phosphate isomerase [Bacteriovoracia bacterium]